MFYCSSAIHHCIIMYLFIVELPSFLPYYTTNHVDLYVRAFWAIPWSRIINIDDHQQLPLSLSAAVGPVHERLLPPRGTA